MSELKHYKFASIYKMSSGISSKPEQAGHGSPFVSFKTVFNNYFLPDELTDLMDSSEIEQKTYSVEKGDIFLTRTSETLEELGMSSVALKNYPKATFSGFLKRLRPNQSEVVYYKYMAFYLRSSLFRKTMNNNALMTLRASFNEQIFSYLNLLLPPYEEQKKAGDLLFLIYEKIELNNRINAELEAMAKTLYDYWFVQFDFPDANGKPYKSSGGKMVYSNELKREIPEGWEVRNVSELANTASGGTPKSTIREYYEGGTIPWINSGELNNPFIISTDNYITKQGLDNSSAKILPKDSILMAMYGATAGKISFLKIEATTNQAICAITPNNSIYQYYIKFYLENLYDYLINLSSGSARDNLSQDKIKKLEILKPKEELLIFFDSILQPIYNKYYIAAVQNQQLASLRDWLLPMLMNGQVGFMEDAKKETPIVSLTQQDQDQRFELWLSSQGLAARGEVDKATLREIFNLMDEEEYGK